VYHIFTSRNTKKTEKREKEKVKHRDISDMDGMQIALPVLGIVAAAAVTFYAVSFNELREVSN
jgi:hypothetical protein